MPAQRDGGAYPQAELENLRWHWGEAFDITRTLGMFRAVRRDDGAAVCAPTADRLLAEISADYQARPVPRDLPPIRTG